MLNILIVGGVLALNGFAYGPEESPAWLGQAGGSETGLVNAQSWSLSALAYGSEESPVWLGQAVGGAGGLVDARRLAQAPVAPPITRPQSGGILPSGCGRPSRCDLFDELILKHSRRNGLDPGLVKAIMATESEFFVRSVSPAGALGLMQVMPATGEEMGVPRAILKNPEANIRAGTDYLNLLFRAAWRMYRIDGSDYRHGPAWLSARVVAAYHGGPIQLARESWPPKTRDYVRKVLRNSRSPVSILSPRLVLSEDAPRLAENTAGR